MLDEGNASEFTAGNILRASPTQPSYGECLSGTSTQIFITELTVVYLFKFLFSALLSLISSLVHISLVSALAQMCQF